jgi:hypothetical protein
MLLRCLLAALLFSTTAYAASHRPVCPGPAAPGTGRCHARVVTDQQGQPLTTTGPVGFGPVQFRTVGGSAVRLRVAPAGRADTNVTHLRESTGIFRL